jgi:hypothetical protein
MGATAENKVLHELSRDAFVEHVRITVGIRVRGRLRRVRPGDEPVDIDLLCGAIYDALKLCGVELFKRPPCAMHSTPAFRTTE